jgi:hypothetical protein
LENIADLYTDYPISATSHIKTTRFWVLLAGVFDDRVKSLGYNLSKTMAFKNVKRNGKEKYPLYQITGKKYKKAYSPLCVAGPGLC